MTWPDVSGVPRLGLQTLQEDVLRVILLSGDSRTTVQTIGRKFAFDDVLAEVLPEEKVQYVTRLQKKGHKVAMAGDGSTMHRL
jgi:Cu+-exporting ATPase